LLTFSEQRLLTESELMDALKRRADQGNKCNENRTHLESDDNLPNGRNVCVINPDEVFGMHTAPNTSARRREEDEGDGKEDDDDDNKNDDGYSE